MPYNFDTIIERRATNSIKWRRYPEDVLPLWVADMDFPAPEPIVAALQERVSHGIFGYEFPTQALTETVAARMERLYGWRISPESVVATSGVIAGFNAAARASCTPSTGILVQPPVYPPFLKVHSNVGLKRQDAPLAMMENGDSIRYEVDFDVFKQAIHSGGRQTGMFLLCSPHNPTGQVYSEGDLMRMGELCLENNITICSDEIHSELLLGGTRHHVLAALSPELANSTITLIAPSKTFNIPGLYCAFAIIPDEDLCTRYRKIMDQMAMHVNLLGFLAAQIAFSGACDDWLAELRLYLTANRDFLVGYVKANFPDIRITIPEATYLAWLDCNELVQSGLINQTPYQFFLKEAKVALNDGVEFGSEGAGFVRLNFGCPRLTLAQALDRMKAALARQ